MCTCFVSEGGGYKLPSSLWMKVLICEGCADKSVPDSFTSLLLPQAHPSPLIMGTCDVQFFSLYSRNLSPLPPLNNVRMFRLTSWCIAAGAFVVCKEVTNWVLTPYFPLHLSPEQSDACIVYATSFSGLSRLLHHTGFAKGKTKTITKLTRLGCWMA